MILEFLDRLMNHGHIIEVRGKSYRLHESGIAARVATATEICVRSERKSRAVYSRHQQLKFSNSLPWKSTRWLRKPRCSRSLTRCKVLVEMAVVNECEYENWPPGTEATRIVSILDPNERQPVELVGHEQKTLNLRFDDVVRDGGGYVLPERSHV